MNDDPTGEHLRKRLRRLPRALTPEEQRLTMDPARARRIVEDNPVLPPDPVPRPPTTGDPLKDLFE